MPIYEYICHRNGVTAEVLHPMADRVETWGRLCELTGADPGDTPPDAPVEKLLFAPGVSAPKSDSELKGMGFTKLVKRLPSMVGPKISFTNLSSDSAPNMGNSTTASAGRSLPSTLLPKGYALWNSTIVLK